MLDVGDSDNSSNNEPDDDLGSKKDTLDEDSDNDSLCNLQPPLIDLDKPTISNGTPLIVSVLHDFIFTQVFESVILCFKEFLEGNQKLYCGFE